MAKTVEIALWDDLDLAEGARTRADVTVRLGWGIPGQGWAVKELELTGKHLAELEGLLGRYLEAGHVPDAPPGTSKGKGYTARGPVTDVRGDLKRRAYWAALRKWVIDNEVMNPRYPGKYAYESPGGHFYYPPWLQARWEAHLAEQADRDG